MAFYLEIMKLKPLNKIIDRLNEAVKEARNGDYRDCDYLSATIKEGKVRFKVYLDDSGIAEVEIHGKKGREYPNIEEYFAERIVRWDDIELEEEPDEWNLNGFRDEEDYFKWKL